MACRHEAGSPEHHSCPCSQEDPNYLEAGSLYPAIKLGSVHALNESVPGAAKSIIRPMRFSDAYDNVLVTAADDELIIVVPFCNVVSISTIVLGLPADQRCPNALRVFANQPSLDFDACASHKPTQEFVISEPESTTTGVLTLPVRTGPFLSTTSVTLHVPASHGAATSALYFLGFLGRDSKWSRPTTLKGRYELMGNIKEHGRPEGADKPSQIIQ